MYLLANNRILVARMEKEKNAPQKGGVCHAISKVNRAMCIMLAMVSEFANKFHV
jgi:hypothetical protein